MKSAALSGDPWCIRLRYVIFAIHAVLASGFTDYCKRVRRPPPVGREERDATAKRSFPGDRAHNYRSTIPGSQSVTPLARCSADGTTDAMI